MQSALIFCVFALASSTIAAENLRQAPAEEAPRKSNILADAIKLVHQPEPAGTEDVAATQIAAVSDATLSALRTQDGAATQTAAVSDDTLSAAQAFAALKADGSDSQPREIAQPTPITSQAVTSAIQPQALGLLSAAQEASQNSLVAQPQPATAQFAAVAQPQPVTSLVVTNAIQPQATVPVAVAQPASPLPASSASAPRAALVTSQLQAKKDVTKMAFGQITDLGTEFHQLREDDQAHVAQLGVDIHLREHLEQELHEAEERLAHDNGELAQETTGIVAPAPSAEVAVPQNATGEMTEALVQSGSISMKPDTDQVAAATARDVKMLDADISSLHTRDVNEVKALRGNAQTRSVLGAQIAKEREELMADSGGLAANLGQIRDLVTSAPSNAAPVDASSNTATSFTEVAQQDTTVQEQLITGAAVDAALETVPAAVSAPAPESAGASTWLR